MSEDSKRKNKNKKSNEKEHRKPRLKPPRQTEKKVELDEKEAEKLVRKPGPDFYRSFKGETDGVLNISKDSPAKYDKKEVQSNWSKYEMPIPSYEDIEAEENMGDDYEQLIQAGSSSGCHFQFKHEKSWNTVAKPTDYDKYFDIDPEALSLALCTILFCERNDMDPDLFSDGEFVMMERETEKYKELYENKLTGHTITVQSVIDKIQEDIDNFKQTKLGEEYDERIAELSVADVLCYNMETHFPMCNEPLSETDDEEFQVPDEEPIASTSRQDVQPSGHAQPTDVHVGASSAQSETKQTSDQSPEDLEKWLDDFLED